MVIISLKYKTLKKEFVSVLKGTAAKSVVFGETAKLRSYPGVRIVFESIDYNDDQVVQNGQYITWDYHITLECQFKGSEGEFTNDNAILFGNSIYNVFYDEKTNNTLFNNEIFNLNVESLTYDTSPSDKGFVYTTIIKLVMVVIENR